MLKLIVHYVKFRHTGLLLQFDESGNKSYFNCYVIN